MNDLPILPEINFLNTDPQAVIDMIITGYEDASGRTLAKGDPVRLFLLTLAAVIIQQRVRIDQAGKSNTLYYAQGDFLDHIGVMRKTARLPASGALCAVEFKLSSIQNQVIGIPRGTRVTSDGVTYWQTTEARQIEIGALSVNIPVMAMMHGEAMNGINIGVINQLVDTIPYIDSVKNINVTYGGSDKESDDSYRARIYGATAAFSTAGPIEAYTFWAKTANPSIIDVKALSPTPGVAEIRPLLKDGVIPNKELLDIVYEALSDETIRPLCDKVEVKAPDSVNYSVEFTYFIRTIDQASQKEIDKRVQQAVKDYVLWQKSKIGRDIVPDELIKRVLAAGAKRLAIKTPVFTKIEDVEIAQDTSISALYGGYENE